MDAKDIIKNIEDFFRTADETALAEVNAAFSLDIEGDVYIEEYLEGFNREYSYSNPLYRNMYTYFEDDLSIGNKYYQQISYEMTASNYEESGLVISSKTKSNDEGQVAKMIKKAA